VKVESFEEFDKHRNDPVFMDYLLKSHLHLQGLGPGGCPGPGRVQGKGGLKVTAAIPEPEDYLYVMTTDRNNVQVTGVKASVDGSPLEIVYAETNGTTITPSLSRKGRRRGIPWRCFRLR